MLSACATSDAPLPTRVILPTDTLSSASSPTLIPPIGVLVFWQAERQTLSGDTPHVWRFAALAGDNIALRVAGIEAQLTLMTDDGAILAQGRFIEYRLPTTGFYRVMVAGDVGIYDIGLAYTDRENPNSPTTIPLTAMVGIPTPNPLVEELGILMGDLRPNTPVQERIAPTMRQRFTFAIESERYIQLEAVADTPENTPRLTLYAPDGTPIATDAGSGTNGSARLRNIRLSDAGVYTVQLIGTADALYTLALTVSDRLVPVIATMTIFAHAHPQSPTYALPEPMPLVAGQRLMPMTPIRARITRPDGVYIYPFFADAGAVVTIGASPSAETRVRLRLELVDPDGNILTRATVNGSVSNGDTVIPAYPIPQTGVYQIFVTSEDGVLGEYTLSYGMGAIRQDRLMGELPRDQNVSSRVDKRGVRDVWMVELRRGDSITLSATPGDLVFDPILELVSVARPQEFLALDDNSGGNRAPFVRSVSIPEDGLYLVRIYAKDAASLGTYTIVWRYVNRASTPTPPPPSIPLLTVRDRVMQDNYVFYAFQGYAGQKITVQVIGESAGFDPVTALIAPSGETLIEADDSDGTLNPSFTITLPADGVYRLRVNGYLSGGVFSAFIRELF